MKMETGKEPHQIRLAGRKTNRTARQGQAETKWGPADVKGQRGWQIQHRADLRQPHGHWLRLCRGDSLFLF